MSPLRHLVIN